MHFAKLKAKLAIDGFIYTKSRKSATKNIVSVVIAITLAVIVSVLIAAAVGYDPGQIFRELFTKGFIDWHKLIFNIVILGVGALAFSFAFRAGVFNIGITGQMLAAGLTVLVVSTALSKFNFPYGSGQVLMTIISIAAGALVASVVAALKVYLKVNEVISSILINWIMFFFVRLIISKFYSDPTQLLTQSYEIPEAFRLVAPGIGGWLPALIILLILVVGMFVIIKYTVFGHKVISVGSSLTASKYAGYNVNAINIATMAISGAIAGLLGYILYTAGETPSIPESMSVNALPNEGMNGIAIGLIAMSNPIAILPISFIIGLFQTSAPFLPTPASFGNLILGFVILGAAMFMIFVRYKPWLWIKQKLYGFYAPKHYQTFENGMESLVSKYKALISERKLTLKLWKKTPSNLSPEILESYKKLDKLVNDYGVNKLPQEYQAKYRRIKEEINQLQKHNQIYLDKKIDWKLESSNLYKEYIVDRTETVAQYKKHILVTKATQFFFPEVEARNLINVKNHEYDMQFIKYKTRQTNNIELCENKIASFGDDQTKVKYYQNKIDKYNANIDKNYQQLFRWKAKTQKQINSWYQWKIKTLGSLDKHYNSFLKQANKLNLNSKEKQLVIEWVKDSYLEAKENSSKGDN